MIEQKDEKSLIESRMREIVQKNEKNGEFSNEAIFDLSILNKLHGALEINGKIIDREQKL